MAKVIFSPLVGDLRNKVGGVVFTKVKAGAMVRRKVSPLQPRTNAQRDVRASFTGLSRAFVALSQTLQTAWRSAAQNFPIRDSLGQAVYLTGLQMYQRINRALQTINQPTIDTPPATLAVSYAGPILLTRTVGPPAVLTCTWTTPANVAATEAAVIFATRPLSPGRSVGGAAFRLVFYGAPGVAGPYQIITQYTDKFGAPIVGRKIFVYAFLVRNTSGAQGGQSQHDVTW